MRAVTTSDGRTLEVHEAGDPNGLAIVVHHGTPSSGVSYRRHDELAADTGVRLITYDRPGYGGSSRAPGRTVADCVADVHAIADDLGLERFATWGISGGGPHALACAALCDDRLVAAASLAGVAPYDADGLDWLAGMGEENHIEFGKTLEGEAALRPYLDDTAAELRGADANALQEAMATLLGPEDRSVLSGDLAAWMTEATDHGLERGVDGWLDDDVAFARDWGFDVAAIERPVLLLHGADDRFVPVSHGRWLAQRIPGVEARITDDDGHLTLIERHVGPLHEWLLRHS